MNIVRHMVTLQRLSMLFQKVIWRRGPCWKLYVINLFLVSSHSKIKFLCVYQEIGITHKKLRNKLLQVAWIVVTVNPFFVDALKKSVGIVEPSSLKLDHPLGLVPDHEPNHVTWTTIVSAVHVL